MKHGIRVLVLLFIAITCCLSLVSNATADSFNPDNIIDDGVFNNTNTMNATQIDSWLNSNFGSTSCISTDAGFSAPDPTGYNPTDGFLYGSNVSAGQVIYDASQAYGINPEVLLTTLQKEQSLVDGSSGCSTLRYAAATGYGCPDGGTEYNYSGIELYSINGVAVTSVSGTCVNKSLEVGFSQQVIHAAWLLEFGDQRSEGNISWAVIQGNWNNSDDPQTCYSGPMTQGTWQICPGGGSTYYDGYTTIDGSSVQMDDGATAALYWYTPHFAGNENFYNIFTSWFGSTIFAQPLGASLDYQQSTGMIYLITGSSSYYIPNWDTMINYGLSIYPVQTVSDATLSQYTNEGTLSNLISDNGNVYLVNNGFTYYLSPTMCTAWGLSCYDDTVVQDLGTTFENQFLQTGWPLTNLADQNGVIYEMSAGQKLPIANPQTLIDLGLNSTDVLVSSAENSNQPLGSLLMATPGVLEFSPGSTIYYYDGSTYYSVPNMESYYDWALNNAPKLAVPTSSYTTTPPSSLTLSPWYEDSSDSLYIINQGRRIQIPTSLQSVWQYATFNKQPQVLANSLPETTLQEYVWTGQDIYELSNGMTHYVPTMTDYYNLGITADQTTNLEPDKVQGATEGNYALGDGTIIAIQGDSQQKLYVINNGETTWIPSPTIFNAYGFNWGGVINCPSTIVSDYPVASLPLGNSLANNVYYIVGTNSMYSLPSGIAGDYGVINSQFQSASTQTIKNVQAPQLSPFLYDTDNSEIYYASGGAIHYVATMSAFIAYGGLNHPASVINNADLSLFLISQTLY
ncbi:MAG: hypothetical protein ACREF5_01705 [Candidatus Saccharimonadales bacterium]